MTELFELLRHFDVSAGVWQGLVNATLKATMILVVAVLGVMSMRRSAPRYRYAMLTIAVFGVLAAPLLSSIMPRYRVPLLPEPTPAMTPFAARPPQTDRPAPLTNQTDAQPANISERNPVAAPPSGNRGATVAIQVADDSPLSSATAATHTTEELASITPSSLPVTIHNAGDSAALSSQGDLEVSTPALVITTWAIGLVAGLLWMLLGTMRVNRWLRRGAVVDDPMVRRVVRQVSQGLRLRRQITLVETDAIDSPVTWGALRPIVLLPAAWRDWSIDRLRIVLLHELTHVRRHDWLVQMCARLACVVYWFNPLVWFVARRLEEVRELACDDDVVRIGTRPSTYAETLLEIATRMRRRPMVAAVALNMAARTRLEGRVLSILCNGRNHQRRGFVLHGALAAVAASVLVMAAIEPWGAHEITVSGKPLVTKRLTAIARQRDIAGTPVESSSPERQVPLLTDGVRSWTRQFKPTAWQAESASGRGEIKLASATELNSMIPGVIAMAAPEAGDSASDRLLDRAAHDRSIFWDKARITYAEQQQAVRRAVLAGDFDEANRAIHRAAQAIETARIYANNASEVDDYRGRIDALRTYVTDEARRSAEESIRQKVAEINQREKARLATIAEGKRRRIEAMMTRAETLNGERRYDEAIQVLDQLIETDPQNERAKWLRGLIEDVRQSHRDRQVVVERHRQARSAYIGLDEDGIPYHDEIRYPADWVRKSARRQSTQNLRESEATRRARGVLKTYAPEIRFDGMAFEDVVDRLRTMTGLNIVPNWAAMEAVAVEKDSEISLALSDVSYEKTLDLILSEVGGGEVELGYEIDDGILRISTKEDLGRHTSFAIYDVHDLIVGVPNFRGPEIDISQAGQNQNQQGGIAGGRFVGSNGGLGGAGSGAGGAGGNGNLFEDSGREGEDVSPDEAIAPLIDLIQQTIEPESWRAAGGNVGSISTMNQQLIVTQTSSAHAQLRDLLQRR